MLNSADTIPEASTLIQASLAIARCRSYGEVIGSMDSCLSAIAGLEGYDVVLLGDDGTFRPQVGHLPFPTAPQELQLAAGQTLTVDDMYYLPLIASAECLGWIVVQSSQPLDPAMPIWVAQCAQALSPLQHEQRQPPAEPVADQAEIALANARLYLEQQHTVDRLTALSGLSIALSTGQLKPDEVITMAVGGAVGTTSAAGGGAIVIFDEHQIAQHGIGIGGDIPSAALEHFVSPDIDYVELSGDQIPATAAAQGIQQILLVPLRGTELTIGYQWTCYTQSLLQQAEREMAVLYAKLAGGVLESLYLVGAVRSAHDRMASILRSTQDGMLLVDESGHITVANRAFGQLLNVETGRLPGQDIARFLGDEPQVALPDDVRRSIATALRAVSDGTEDGAEGEVTLGDALEHDLTWRVLAVSGTTTTERSNALLLVRDVTADRQMERLRQDLTNMIVHDLRSPLTNVMVSINLLLKQSIGTASENQSRILNIASHSCQQMLDLVNSLLDISRMQQQTLDIQFHPLLLADLAESVAERIAPIANDKRVSLKIDLDTLPEVEGDADMLRRVLQNLADNGLKFTRPNSAVEIRGHVAEPGELPVGHPPGRWALIEVDDHGPGIPPEFHQIIFELFAQAPAGYGHGTGVGLAFCKLAVEAHGGQIWVRTFREHGSTFAFTLPLAP